MNKVLITLSLLFAPLMSFGAAYDEDTTNFFVSGSGANEALKLVNQIICYTRNTMNDKFVNDGIYKATIYADDCVTTDASSASAAGAKPKSSKASGSNEAAGTTEKKTVSTGILKVTRVDKDSPILTKAWFALVVKEEQQGQTLEMNIDVFMDMVQTKKTTADAPQGEWSMRYSLAAGADIQMGPGAEDIIPMGTPMGIGYIDAKGKALRFKDNGFNGQGNVIANFAENGDIEGIYLEENYVGDDRSGFQVFAQNAFVVDATNKIFCKKVLAAEQVDFGNLDPETFAPTRSDYTITADDGLSTEETCYSTDVTKAYRHVWRYGVYGADGNRFDLSNQAFPIRAVIGKDTADEEEVFGYAGYWGIHVDPKSIGSVSDTLEFEKDDFEGAAGDARPKYTLKAKNLRLEKRSKEYVSLNSLNGMTLGINMAQDTYWAAQLRTVNAALADNSTYQEYEGSFNSETQTFTFIDGVKFFPNYSKESLSTPISFTVNDWLTKMKKVIGEGEDWEFTEYANMHVYSHDTQQGYSINEKALNNPTDGTAPTADNDTSAGVASEVSSVVKDFSEIAGGLKCLFECPKSDLLRATYQDAASKAQNAFSSGGITSSASSSLSPSPYAAAGPFVVENKTVVINYCPDGVDSDDCKENREYQAGQWVDGLIASEITNYTVDNGVISENGQALTTGIGDTIKALMAAGTIREARDFFSGAKFEMPDGGGQNREIELSWGIQSGPLVLASDLSKLECTKNQDTGKYEGDTPPEFTDAEAAETRYCIDKLWSNKTLTTYNLIFETQPAFEIFDSGGSPVAFDPPKMLYFSVPQDEVLYGEDAGKNLRLEYGGFGDLHGIPGQVININTGESLGQYFDGEWKDNYRYLSRFLIPSGSSVEDKVTGLSYKVKALNGEEYLSLAPNSKGLVTYSASASDLVPDSLMIDVGPNGGDNYIGARPLKTEMINEGEPAVIHGKVLFDPSAQ